MSENKITKEEYRFIDNNKDIISYIDRYGFRKDEQLYKNKYLIGEDVLLSLYSLKKHEEEINKKYNPNFISDCGIDSFVMKHNNKIAKVIEKYVDDFGIWWSGSNIDGEMCFIPDIMLLPPKPNYKKRTLIKEDVKFNTESYNEICVLCKNKEEIEEFHKFLLPLGYRWSSDGVDPMTNILKSIQNGGYIFIKPKREVNSDMNLMMCVLHTDISTIESILSDEYTFPYILNFSDEKERIYNIIKYKKDFFKPNYNKRKLIKEQMMNNDGKTNIIHFFDLDGTLWDLPTRAWIIDKKHPSRPILKLDNLELKKILYGYYKKDDILIDYNGDEYYISENILNKCKSKIKNIEKERIGLSFIEFIDTDYDKITFLKNNIKHLIGKSGYDIGILSMRYDVEQDEQLLTVLRNELNNLGLEINKFFYIGDFFRPRIDDTTSIGKMNVILEHLVGFHIKNGKFEPIKQDIYREIYFYDDEFNNINTCKQIQMYLEEYLRSTEDDVFERILKNIKETKPVLYLNHITNNKQNEFKTFKIELHEPVRYPVRIDESLNMNDIDSPHLDLKKYRFKTEKEFITQYGQNWRKVVLFNSFGSMDYLIGRNLSDFEITRDRNFLRRASYTDYTDNKIICQIEGRWTVFSKMITSSEPTYNPRKLIKESNDIFEYYFKTEDEFVSEYGKGWRELGELEWVDEMDYLFGQKVDFNKIIKITDSDKYYVDFVNKTIDLNSNYEIPTDDLISMDYYDKEYYFYGKKRGKLIYCLFKYDDYIISNYMIKQVKCVPSYKPKRKLIID